MTAPSGQQGYCPMGQLTTGELEAYGEKLTQCLKDAGMDGAIRGDVQRELMAVLAEQEARVWACKPDGRERHYRVDLATDELEQIRRDLQTTLAFMREGSSARGPVLAYIEAIDTELEARAKRAKP
jgi:hypothetical protein